MKKPLISFNELNVRISTIKSALCSLKKRGMFGIESFSVIQSSTKEIFKIKARIIRADNKSPIVINFDSFFPINFDNVKHVIEQSIKEKDGAENEKNQTAIKSN
ncbi:MAG: hypothetical protein QMD65_00170 [Patescibacteria group bacterium]|nr:hypothetical protein [Patescibacteria group bacterium]